MIFAYWAEMRIFLVALILSPLIGFGRMINPEVAKKRVMDSYRERETAEEAVRKGNELNIEKCSAAPESLECQRAYYGLFDLLAKETRVFIKSQRALLNYYDSTGDVSENELRLTAKSLNPDKLCRNFDPRKGKERVEQAKRKCFVEVENLREEFSLRAQVEKEDQAGEIPVLETAEEAERVSAIETVSNKDTGEQKVVFTKATEGGIFALIPKFESSANSIIIAYGALGNVTKNLSLVFPLEFKNEQGEVKKAIHEIRLGPAASGAEISLEDQVKGPQIHGFEIYRKRSFSSKSGLTDQEKELVKSFIKSHAHLAYKDEILLSEVRVIEGKPHQMTFHANSKENSEELKLLRSFPVSIVEEKTSTSK